MEIKKRVLAGIQPSGTLHIGNYFGSIKELVQEQEQNNVFAFIANYHAQTSLNDGELLKQYTLNCAIDFLSLGIDSSKTNFWVQSDVKEVLELYWILSSFTPMGLLQRGHSYKDKVAKGINANHSLFSYPVLMASDILLFDSQIVPVGKDQIQHIEMTRDIAMKFNAHFDKEIFVLPEYKVNDNVATIVGLDGQKMSKSYNNTINIFDDEKKLKKTIGKIVTDSTPLEEPKEYENCNVYNIAKHFLDKNEKIELQNRYKAGGEGYGHFKAYLKEKMIEYFAPYREKREYYLSHTDEVRDVLNDGAKKVSQIATNKIEQIRDIVGIKY
jgi:tryptophanyl-tRNA synthetase